MPTRGSPSSSSTRPPSSSKSRPSGPWVPAVFSSSTGQLSVSASAAAIAFAARFIDGPSGSPLRAPACRTTPSAPIPSPTRSAWVSEAIDFARISRSLLAQLIR